MLYFLLIVAAILAILDRIFNHNAKARLVTKIPGPKRDFLIGHAWSIYLNPVQLFQYVRDAAKKFPGIYLLHAYPVSIINIYNPEDVETITSVMKHHQKSKVYTFLEPWLNQGLLVSNGPKWQARRKILTSAFHFNVLQKYFATMKDNDEVLIETLRNARGDPVDVTSVMSDYTLNVICESAMGIDLKAEEGKKGVEYKKAISDLAKYLVYRFTNVYIYSDFIFNMTWLGKRQNKYLKVVHDFTSAIIEKRKKAIAANEVISVDDDEDEFLGKKKRAAMLDLLIAKQKEGVIDDNGIQEEVDTFMFEGHDTTASGLTFTILLLANHQDIQDKVAKEINDYFGKDTRHATMEDLAALKYLDLVVKESLRLYPPVPFIMREITQPCKLSNFDIPANTMCSIHIYDLHRDPKYYPDPEKFDPDRFLPENSAGRHNYAYLPFSAGPRNCVGQKYALMEMKTSLVSILRHFNIVPVTKIEDLCFSVDLVLRTKDPIYVSFTERKQD